MKVTAGVELILMVTERFDESVTFFRDLIGLVLTSEGLPVSEKRFTRYAQFRMANGVTLEIVEPEEGLNQSFSGVVPSISVDDVVEARREMESKGTEFLSSIVFDGQGFGWSYFRAPDGNVFQIQGPFKMESDA